MEINMEKTLYDVKLKQDALWELAVFVFWLAAAVFLYALGAAILVFFGAEPWGVLATLLWLIATVFGLIGLVKGICIVWQNWS